MGRDYKVNKEGLGWGSPSASAVGQKVSTRHYCGKISGNLFQELNMLGCQA